MFVTRGWKLRWARRGEKPLFRPFPGALLPSTHAFQCGIKKQFWNKRLSMHSSLFPRLSHSSIIPSSCHDSPCGRLASDSSRVIWPMVGSFTCGNWMKNPSWPRPFLRPACLQPGIFLHRLTLNIFVLGLLNGGMETWVGFDFQVPTASQKQAQQANSRVLRFTISHTTAYFLPIFLSCLPSFLTIYIKVTKVTYTGSSTWVDGFC